MLSFRIWEDVVRLQLDRVIVFEDDLRFSLDGLERIKEVIEDLDASQKPWDLIYLGRKKQDTDKVGLIFIARIIYFYVIIHCEYFFLENEITTKRFLVF